MGTSKGCGVGNRGVGDARHLGDVRLKLAFWFVVWAFVFACTISQTAHGCKKDYEDCPAGPCKCYMPAPAEGPAPRNPKAEIEASKKWTSDEKPPHNPQPAWETGEIKSSNLPVQTWNPHDGGTEIADQIKKVKSTSTVEDSYDGKKP